MDDGDRLCEFELSGFDAVHLSEDGGGGKVGEGRGRGIGIRRVSTGMGV